MYINTLSTEGRLPVMALCHRPGLLPQCCCWRLDIARESVLGPSIGEESRARIVFVYSERRMKSPVPNPFFFSFCESAKRSLSLYLSLFEIQGCVRSKYASLPRPAFVGVVRNCLPPKLERSFSGLP